MALHDVAFGPAAGTCSPKLNSMHHFPTREISRLPSQKHHQQGPLRTTPLRPQQEHTLDSRSIHSPVHGADSRSRLYPLTRPQRRQQEHPFVSTLRRQQEHPLTSPLHRQQESSLISHLRPQQEHQLTSPPRRQQELHLNSVPLNQLLETHLNQRLHRPRPLINTTRRRL